MYRYRKNSIYRNQCSPGFSILIKSEAGAGYSAYLASATT